MKTQPLLQSALIALLAAGSIGAQASSPSIVGSWRADAPLPNGVVQTFRFGPDGTFDLTMSLAVDGTYRVDGTRLVETVALPGVDVAHTDTAAFAITGDSLTVNERAGAPPRVLHRSTRSLAASSIVGDWAILVDGRTAVHYIFTGDGAMRVRAQVGSEQGKYVIRTDTLHLSNDQTFQLPAIAQFMVADSVLTLTPLNGKQSRQFHKVAAVP